jgi:hypothetical protein
VSAGRSFASRSETHLNCSPSGARSYHAREWRETRHLQRVRRGRQRHYRRRDDHAPRRRHGARCSYPFADTGRDAYGGDPRKSIINACVFDALYYLCVAIVTSRASGCGTTSCSRSAKEAGRERSVVLPGDGREYTRDRTFKDFASVSCVFYNTITLDINLLCQMLGDVVLRAHVNPKDYTRRKPDGYFAGAAHEAANLR